MAQLRGCRPALAVVALLALAALPGVAWAEQPPSMNTTVIPASQVFACGAGNTFTSVGITDAGAVLKFESPAGKEHILVAYLGSGFAVCKTTGAGFTMSQEFSGGAISGWAGVPVVSQPNGPNTFPLEITRTTVDGLLTVTRRITGNSFVGPAGPGGTYDPDFNGVGCSSMAECGNCGNRTIHVLTRLKNNTGAVMTVRVVEASDFDISGSPGAERGWKTQTSTGAFEDLADGGADADAHGMLIQAMVLVPAQVSVPGVGGVTTGVAADCTLPAGLVTPTGPADPEVAMRQDVTLGPGATDGANVRVHYRRY